MSVKDKLNPSPNPSDKGWSYILIELLKALGGGVGIVALLVYFWPKGTPPRPPHTTPDVTSTSRTPETAGDSVRLPQVDPSPNSLPNREWPFQIRSVCGNEAASKSLEVSIKEKKEQYDKRLIDSDNFDIRQNEFFNEMRRLMEEGKQTKDCISQELVYVRGLFTREIIDASQWKSIRNILWKKIDELLVKNVQSAEDLQQALEEIRNLREDQHAIDNSQHKATMKALNEKRLGSISGNSLPR